MRYINGQVKWYGEAASLHRSEDLTIQRSQDPKNQIQTKRSHYLWSLKTNLQCGYWLKFGNNCHVAGGSTERVSVKVEDLSAAATGGDQQFFFKVIVKAKAVCHQRHHITLNIAAAATAEQKRVTGGVTSSQSMMISCKFSVSTEWRWIIVEGCRHAGPTLLWQTARRRRSHGRNIVGDRRGWQQPWCHRRRVAVGARKPAACTVNRRWIRKWFVTWSRIFLCCRSYVDRFAHTFQLCRIYFWCLIY